MTDNYKHIILTLVLILTTLIVFGQKQIVIKSEYLNAPDTVWIFSPNDYDSKEAVPVIFLLHGWSGNYHQWDDIINCQEYANDYGTIIVCPDGLYDSWYLNSPVVSENQYESFFREDLIPTIEENYSINNDSVFITGFSMGGHGALYLYEKLSDYFNSAGSLSGLLDLSSWSDHYGISRVLGLDISDNDQYILSEFSVVNNLDNISDNNKQIIVSCGTEDPFHDINTEFIKVCNSKGIQNIFLESGGGHNADYWKSNIGDQFDFFYK